ncbi:MAG TPA: SUMF1/EgtB/PvdO family nonheme iron enzyme [Pirellulales bacterium]|nr:SUMF1/EgtB/PvdO family nonheme iron enzyme [Pirellulales bacterium]
MPIDDTSQAAPSANQEQAANSPLPPAEFEITTGAFTMPDDPRKTSDALPEDGLPSPSPAKETAPEDGLPSPSPVKEAAPEDGLPSPSPRTPSPANATAWEGHPPAPLGRIRDYELLEKLGEGGMGAVYKALHVKLKRPVAIKILPRERLLDPQAVARFNREMEAVGQLIHPNIVLAHDAGEADGQHYLVMELVEGMDLTQLVARLGPLPIADACELVRQAALGLAHAHRFGLVHRDIKPSNLILTSAGQTKILDLGLALLNSAQPSGELTGACQVMGTADYMAPEQAADSHAVDIRADIYSLGCTLYKLLTGEPPFTGPQYKTALSKLMAHQQTVPPAVYQVRGGVPAALSNLVGRTLAKSPSERHAMPEDLAAALKPFCKASNLAALYARAAGQPVPAPAKQDSETASSAASALQQTDGGQQPLPPATAPASPSIAADSARSANDRRSRFPTRKLAAASMAIVLLGGALPAIKDGFRSSTRSDVPINRSVADAKSGDTDTPPGDAGADNPPSKTEGPEPRTKSGIPATAGWHGWPADAPAPAIAPFDDKQARKHQQEWADYLKLPLEYTNTIGMKFILIPPGEFTMGSTAEEIDETLKAVGDDTHWQECVKGEGPAHQVVLTRPFYLAVHEVTQKEYATIAGSNPSHFAEAGSGSDQVVGLGTANFPVEKVSWNDAAEFCAKLCKHEDLKPSYFRGGETVSSLKGMGYRLPTEAEWEFACRAGTSTRFWIGDKDQELTAAGWFSRNSGGRTHEVEELLGNPFGLFDVHANVWEWVEDGWQAKYYERLAESGAIDPSYPFSAGSQCVLRGGDWHFNASYCRSSRRLAYEPTARDTDIGFRVALSADALRRELPTTTSSAAAATSANTNANTPTPAPAPTKTPDASPAAQPRAEARTPASLLRRPSVPEGGAWPADAPSPAIAPFDDKQARKHQQEWADYLKLPLEHTNSIGMKFILIPPGEFMMGSTPAEVERAVFDVGGTQFWEDCVRSEAPQHKVVLTRPWYFSAHEVTQKEYEDIMGVNPSYFAKTGPDEKNGNRLPISIPRTSRSKAWAGTTPRSSARS